MYLVILASIHYIYIKVIIGICIVTICNTGSPVSKMRGKITVSIPCTREMKEYARIVGYKSFVSKSPNAWLER